MTNEEKLDQFFNSDYCDGVSCTKHDHSGMYERMKNYADKISMTQPTIKEKMEGVIEAIAGGVTHFEMNGRNNAEEYIEKARAEMRDFARLICEEMINKENNLWEPGDSLEEKFGWDQCVEEQKAKAQEILKALE